jgi:hypothetical protein
MGLYSGSAEWHGSTRSNLVTEKEVDMSTKVVMEATNILRGVYRASSRPLLFAVGWCVLAGSPLQAGMRVMVLDSAPPGAKVEHAGKLIGTTPLQLEYPEAYFKAPNTVWGRHLSAPLEFKLTLKGFQAKSVRIGNGPFSWTSLNGANRFEFYLLDLSYRIVLDPEGANQHSDPSGYLEDLQMLADLRDRGVLTEDEFQQKKQEILAHSDAPAPPARDRYYFARQEVHSFCQSLLPAEVWTGLTPERSRVYNELKVVNAAVNEPYLHEAGDVLQCLLTAPSEEVGFVKMLVECGLHIDEAEACAGRAPGSEYLDDVKCFSKDGPGDGVVVLNNGCLFTLSTSGTDEATTSDEDLFNKIAAVAVATLTE